MRSIDIHAHLTPQCFWRATEDGGDWHTLRREQDARGREYAVVGGRRSNCRHGRAGRLRNGSRIWTRWAWTSMSCRRSPAFITTIWTRRGRSDVPRFQQ